MAFPRIKNGHYDYGIAGGTIIVERTVGGRKETFSFPIDNLKSAYQTLKDGDQGVLVRAVAQEVAGSVGDDPYPVFPGGLPNW